MKIMFVRPRPEEETIGLQHVMVVEPLELEVLAATLDSDDTPVIIDMILEKKSFSYYLKREKPDVIALTGYITNVGTIIKYCKIAKKFNKDIKTVVGGVHMEVVPEDFNNEFIDYKVVRNATTEFPKLISNLKGEKNTLSCIFKQGEEIDFDTIPQIDFYFPHPRRDLVNRYRKDYFYIFHNNVALIKTAFGCPFKCNFCFCRKITYDKYHPREMEDVLDELEGIKEKEIYIVDDDFLIAEKRLKEFFKGIKSRGIKKKYLVYARSDFIIKNKNLVRDFKKLGLRTVIVGFESFFPEELEKYNKNNDVNTNKECMKFLNKIGIDCYATVIVSPEWSKKDFVRVGNILRSLDVKFVNLQPLTPIPKTGFHVPKERVVIERKDYAKWDLAHVSIQPNHMSVAEFYLEIIKLYERVVFRPKVMLNHLRYSPAMIFKMFKGSYLVHKQYMEKYREAKDA